MMISPDWYIERNIKGKSKRHILAEIRQLKALITKLEKEVENPNSLMIVRPSPETKLKVNREYLKAAEDYLAKHF